MNSCIRTWKYRDREWELGINPLIMGIVNVTPDSFSDGGSFFAIEAAVQHGLSLIDQGADILDIGGESTRPGAAIVDLDEELRRVVPVIAELAKATKIPISIDTTKAEVAARALEAGATIVNDIAGLRFDDAMPAVCREHGAGVICMHMQGTPQTMQVDPRYGDVIAEICDFFEERLDSLERAGIARESIVLDPGVGFGKRTVHNLAILSNVERFRALGRPVLIGHSRKGFLGKALGRNVDERSAGTLGVSIALAEQSADILRVHDVRNTRDAIDAWKIVREFRNDGGIR
ncbi:MAG: dihydropteroate synthase [Planctomycetaceae bacterium]